MFTLLKVGSYIVMLESSVKTANGIKYEKLMCLVSQTALTLYSSYIYCSIRHHVNGKKRTINNKNLLNMRIVVNKIYETLNAYCGYHKKRQ